MELADADGATEAREEKKKLARVDVIRSDESRVQFHGRLRAAPALDLQ